MRSQAHHAQRCERWLEALEHSQLLLRVRPCEKPSPLVVVNEKDARVEVGEADGRPPSTPTLQFDQVFWDDQQELFARLQPALLSCIGGASCTVLAHGGPQSGKSYTLSGLFTSGETHGVAPRAIQAITEELERLTTPVPSVDASFFELQQDAVCDLLAAGAPRVAMRETTQPPFVALDQHLSAMRCDGASGFNRLLDAYFTGLEHRRKGHHTCFQITFTRANRKRSYLRLVEMAWPRPQAGKGTGAGKASTALEQVLQSKLSGTTCGYRGAPLALLLKPCLEGASSLCFIHCMRLDPPHLSCLGTSSPLLTKIFQWLSQERKAASKSKAEGAGAARGDARDARDPGGRRVATAAGVVVPPLHLGSTGGSGMLSSGVVEAEPEGIGHATSATSVMSSGSSSRSSSKPPMVGATSEDTVTGGEGGTGEASISVKPLTSEAEDSQITELIAQLLQVKRRTVEALEEDAKQSSGAFQELDTLLGHIMSSREANGNGPDERETNLKLVYEQVYRSIQRSTEEATKIRHEVQELESFCRKGYIPPIYDAYAASQQEIQKMKEPGVQVLPEGVQEEKQLNVPMPPAPQVIEIPQLPLSCLQGDQEVVPKYLEGLGSSSSSGSSSEPRPCTKAPSAKAKAKAVPIGLATAPAALVKPGNWAQAFDPVPQGPPAAVTPPVPMAVGHRMPGAGSPMLPYRPVSPQVGSVQMGWQAQGGLTSVASESMLKPMQASPPRFHTNGRCPVQGGGSMTVGPGAGMMCQVGSPLPGFRTTTPNKAAALVSPVLMTRTLPAQAPGMPMMGSPPAACRIPAKAGPSDARGSATAAALRGCRSAAELPRPAWALQLRG